MSDEELKADRENRDSRPSRRDVLQRAGLAVAAAALPALPVPVAAAAAPQREPLTDPAQTMADYPISEVMTQFSTYISQAGDRMLPDNVVEQAKWHILDTFAAMISGSELPAGKAAIKFANMYGGKPVATIVADTALCGPIEAAMANGVMAHADETDDTLNGPWHPGCNVVPSALAMGEQFHNDGVRFLRAVVLGYDIGTRVLNTVQPGMRNSHKLSYGIGGVFGSAAAASSAAKLTPEQVRWAISYAAQQCSGIESFPRDLDHIEKGFIFGGMPARSGVTAALLVQMGWNAVNDIMSGPDNFLIANAPMTKPELLVDKLGEDYEMLNANIKRWTVGAPIQVVLDALEGMLSKQAIDASQVQEVLLRYMPDSITDNSGAPDINVQFATAVMLIDKTVTFRSIHDTARMRDPAIVALRSKVKLVPGPRGDARPPLVQITMANGDHLVQDQIGRGVLGTAANPMTREQLLAKCHDLIAPVVGEAQTKRLIDRVFELEKVKDIHELRPLLQRKAHAGTAKLSEYPSAK